MYKEHESTLENLKHYEIWGGITHPLIIDIYMDPK
jgi:hypothetical protein